MLRYIASLAAAALIGAPIWAGELDKEFGAKTPSAPAAKQNTATPIGATATAPLTADTRSKGSELDGETPTQAARGYRGGWGHGGGHGWGHGWGHSWGHNSYGWGRGWHSGWRGYGWAGYGRGYGWGWGSYGYLPYVSYYPSYVSYGYYPGWCW